MTSVAPGSAARLANLYYKTDEELLFAHADALREEYKAIVDAGLMLQLDDPAMADNWDMINPEPAVQDYKKFAMVRVEALNHAIKGLPQDRIRFHLCWVAGTARTPLIFLCVTLSMSCWPSMHRHTLSRRETSAMSTSGRCGRTQRFPTTNSFCLAWSAMPPT